MTDILIFLDTSWEYGYVQNYLNYIVQRLNVNPIGSSLTLLAASDGSVIVNRTKYLTEFYEKWNSTTHAQYRNGFSLPIILSKSLDLAETLMQVERNASRLGGRSLIALLMPSPTAFVHEYDIEYCHRFLNNIRRSVPDLHFIYYAGGAIIRLQEYALNPKEDVLLLSYDISVEDSAAPVVERIKRVPRHLSNPRCLPNWSAQSWGMNQQLFFESLGKINFYRISPQYFYTEGSMRYLKVKPQSSVAYNVCTSRRVVQPFRNPSSANTPGQDCQQISSRDFSYDLGDLCLGYDSLEQCPPLYISVQAQSTADISQVYCKEPQCSRPDETQFLIVVNNLDCTNGAAVVVSGFICNIIFILMNLFIFKISF